jgi:hypothetical protein
MIKNRYYLLKKINTSRKTDIYLLKRLNIARLAYIINRYLPSKEIKHSQTGIHNKQIFTF